MTFMFQNIWDDPSHWLIFFKMVKTTNQYCTVKLILKMIGSESLEMLVIWEYMRHSFSMFQHEMRPSYQVAWSCGVPMGTQVRWRAAFRLLQGLANLIRCLAEALRAVLSPKLGKKWLMGTGWNGWVWDWEWTAWLVMLQNSANPMGLWWSYDLEREGEIVWERQRDSNVT